LGLNPHAGESGKIGKEEQEIIVPLIQKLNKNGHIVVGPFPADGFFGSGQYKEFDGILAMYHDQGLGPFKALAFDDGVNYTGGLSIVRTSPDHGTAYNIAGKGTANANSLRQAIYLASDIARRRKQNIEDKARK
jgi:4-hydroxythreonine-4-phosphate dehydrogenase